MLSVGVDAAAERVLALERPVVAGGDPGLQAAIHAERQHLGAVGAGDCGGGVGRAVVDDEHVDVGQLPVQVVEDGRQVLLLVPRRDEDDGVAHVPDAPELGLGRAELIVTQRQRDQLPRERAQRRHDVRDTEADVDPGRHEELPEEPARAVQVERRAHDDGALDAAVAEERQRSGRVLGGVPRERLEHDLDVDALPEPAHLLRLGRVPHRPPAAEDDDLGAHLRRESLRLGTSRAQRSLIRYRPRRSNEPCPGTTIAVRTPAA